MTSNSKDWRKVGNAKIQGAMRAQEEVNIKTGDTRFRLSTPRILNMLLYINELFDLAELLDDVCDEVEDRSA